MFSVGSYIRVWTHTSFYYIILFSRLIYDLGMSEWLSPLAPSWYRES
jgi:hypothetical protein